MDQTIAVIRKQMGRKLPASQALDADTVIEDLGISSLMMTEIFFSIEEQVGCELDPSSTTGVRTIGELVAQVNRLAAVDAG